MSPRIPSIPVWRERTAAICPQASIPDWHSFVTRIQAGDRAAETELYRVFSRGIRLRLLRQLGPEGLEDNLHECFIASIEAIRSGQIRQPERLMGFVGVIAQRKVGERVGERVKDRRRMVSIEESGFNQSFRTLETPEDILLSKERFAMMQSAVASLRGREREIVTRFYTLDQSREQICQELNMTESQFRVVKSRTVAKLASNAQRATRRARSRGSVGELKKIPMVPS